MVILTPESEVVLPAAAVAASIVENFLGVPAAMKNEEL